MQNSPKKPDRTEQALRALHALQGVPRSIGLIEQVRGALSDKSSFVVAAAAELAGERELTELQPDLTAAFARFLSGAPKNDKGCKAKIALASALHRMGLEDAALFRQGLRYRQPEPGWGGSQDSAAELRGICALAISYSGGVDAVEELADVLADPEAATRALCARALGASGRSDAVPLLRYKLRIGDPANEVLLECCAGLLSLCAGRALPLLAAVLERPEESGSEAASEAAALALGQSRLPEALPLLQGYADRLPLGAQRAALVAIAMLRSPAAISDLCARVAEAPISSAMDAVRALAMHRYDDGLRARVGDLVRTRGHVALQREYGDAFGPVSVSNRRAD